MSLTELEDRLTNKKGKELPATGLMNIALAYLKAQEKKAALPEKTGEELDVLDLVVKSDLSGERKLELLRAELGRTDERRRKLCEAMEGLNV